MTTKTRIIPVLLICFFASFCYQGTTSIAYAEEVYKKTSNDPRDLYLSVEALCGVEGLPYEYLIPKEKFIKTKLAKDDLYIEMDDFCGEDLPYTLVVPRKFIKTKIDYKEDLKSGAEALMSEDPTSLEIESK